MIQPFKDYTESVGINNRSEPTSLNDKYLVEAQNVDIDDNGIVSRRGGYSAFAGITSSHSAWGNGRNIYVATYTSPSTYTLSLFNTISETFSTILTLDAAEYIHRWSFVALPDKRVFATNGVRIGYLEEGSWSSLETPSGSYKIPIKPGHLATYYNGCVWVARGNAIWVSDPLKYYQVDARRGFLQLEGFITLLEGMGSGLIAADGRIVALMGKEQKELELTTKYEYNAILGSVARVDGGMLVGDKQYNGTNILFSSEQGICLGTDECDVVNLTQRKYVMPAATNAAAVYRVNSKNTGQYVSVLY